MKFHKFSETHTWISNKGKDRMDTIEFNALLQFLKKRYPDRRWEMYKKQKVWTYPATPEQLEAVVNEFKVGWR